MAPVMAWMSMFDPGDRSAHVSGKEKDVLVRVSIDITECLQCLASYFINATLGDNTGHACGTTGGVKPRYQCCIRHN